MLDILMLVAWSWAIWWVIQKLKIMRASYDNFKSRVIVPNTIVVEQTTLTKEAQKKPARKIDDALHKEYAVQDDLLKEWG